MQSPPHDGPGHRRADRYSRIAEGVSEEIGGRLRDAREDAGLSQGALGDMLGYAPTMISAFENGRRRLKLEDLARVCIALGKDPEYFLRTASVAPAAPDPQVGMLLRAEVAELRSDLLREALTAYLDEIDQGEPIRSDVPDLRHLKPGPAARQLRELCRVKTPRIELDDVCAQLGIRIYPRPFPDSLSAVLVAVGDDDYAIAVNTSHHPHRRRFS